LATKHCLLGCTAESLPGKAQLIYTNIAIFPTLERNDDRNEVLLSFVVWHSKNFYGTADKFLTY
jgi:hypothetical protein